MKEQDLTLTDWTKRFDRLCGLYERIVASNFPQNKKNAPQRIFLGSTESIETVGTCIDTRPLSRFKHIIGNSLTLMKTISELTEESKKNGGPEVKFPANYVQAAISEYHSTRGYLAEILRDEELAQADIHRQDSKLERENERLLAISEELTKQGCYQSTGIAYSDLLRKRQRTK